jgi:iron(III) transport system permease protein
MSLFWVPAPGIHYEYITQKVAKPASRRSGVDNRSGYLCSAVVHRDTELLIGSLFSPAKEWSFESFGFIFTDPDFYKALRSGFILAFGLVVIAIPLGGVLAFLMVRTDLPGRRLIEPLILVPIFVSPMVLGFGYVVAAGPVGFLSLWAQSLIGFVPWNIYDMSSIVVIAGLTHVPHAYLYISSALRSVGSDVEEAARTAGASPCRS